MADLSKHPLLKQAYEVIQTIEACGASPELTGAVIQAGALLSAIDECLAGGVLSVKQEPKYDVRYGKLVNRATGNPIPDDEPIMILRAQDIHARATVRRYVDLITNNEGAAQTPHQKTCFGRYQSFVDFAHRHPERMKTPDTAPEAT